MPPKIPDEKPFRNVYLRRVGIITFVVTLAMGMLLGNSLARMQVANERRARYGEIGEKRDALRAVHAGEMAVLEVAKTAELYRVREHFARETEKLRQPLDPKTTAPP